MAMFKRVAPIFPVADLAAAMAHYQRLGFAVREYEGGGYAYATREGIEIHLGQVRDHDAHRSTSALYLWVDDADELAEAWRSAGVDVRGPEDTEWRQREGVHIDPDGNVIRFGTPLTTRTRREP